MRGSLLVLVCAACGAQLDGAKEVDAPPPPIDAPPPPIDTPPPVDARACAGGDAAMAVSDGSCIVRFDTVLTFANAEAACVAFNAHLATLSTSDRDAVAKALVGTANVWTGLNDRVTEGSFIWVDGTAVSFTDFATGEPNNAGNVFQEDCVIWAGARPGWDDRPCDNSDPAATAPGEYAYLCMF